MAGVSLADLRAQRNPVVEALSPAAFEAIHGRVSTRVLAGGPLVSVPPLVTRTILVSRAEAGVNRIILEASRMPYHVPSNGNRIFSDLIRTLLDPSIVGISNAIREMLDLPEPQAPGASTGPAELRGSEKSAYDASLQAGLSAAESCGPTAGVDGTDLFERQD